MKLMRVYFIVAVFVFSLTAAARAADDANKNTSGLPLPRYASLARDTANMRTGPGTRYPIEWVYTRQGLPVEITAEYDVWRRVRDPDGAEGWIHKTELSHKRTATVTGAAHDLLAAADDKASIVAHLDAGSIGQIVSCAKDWCKLKFDSDIKGYLRKTFVWGAYPNEVFD